MRVPLVRVYLCPLVCVCKVCDCVYLCPVCAGGLGSQGLHPVAVLRRSPAVVLGVGGAGGAAMLAEEAELNTIISK